MAGVRSGGCTALQTPAGSSEGSSPKCWGWNAQMKTAFFSDTRDKPEEGEVTVGGGSTRFSSLRAASSHRMVCRKEASRRPGPRYLSGLC